MMPCHEVMGILNTPLLYLKRIVPILRVVLVICLWLGTGSCIVQAEEVFCPSIQSVELDREQVVAGESLLICLNWFTKSTTTHQHQLALYLVGIGRPPDFSTNLLLTPSTREWKTGKKIQTRPVEINIPASLHTGWYRMLLSAVEVEGTTSRVIQLDDADRLEHNFQYCFGEIEVLPQGSSGKREKVIRWNLLDPARPDRPNEEWRMRHAERIADARSHADTMKTLFIGDSITGGWRDIGKEIWDREFVSLNAVNIGIAGSQTSHILWQIEHGAIDGIHPKVAILMIGVNNLVFSPSQSSSDIARGIKAIISQLRKRLPETKILLLGTFRKDRSEGSLDRVKIKEINQKISRLSNSRMIRFEDIGDRFLDHSGGLTPEISPDGVHLTPKGYQVWADSILPILKEMLSDPVSSEGGHH